MKGLTNRLSRWTFSCAALLAAVLVIGFSLQVVFAATPQSGIDCNSTKVGNFVSPIAPPQLPIRPTYSTHGIYQVAAQYGSGTTPPITLTISKDAVTVMTLDVPYTSNWGFSPDDDRFVYHYLDGDYHTVRLYDLTRPGTTEFGKLVTSFAGPVGAASVVFSPHGQYFMYARLTGGMVPATYINVVDARTGAGKYETNFTADIPPQDDGKVRVANWGFSPDTLDRTFVYAYITGQTSTQLTAVNLDAATVAERLVHEETFVGVVAASWKFSLSGDVLGVVMQPNQTSMTISLHRTLYRQQLVSLGVAQVGTVQLKTTLASHLYNVNSTGDYVLAPNTADDACSTPGTAELSSLAVSPSTVTSGGSATGTVTLTAAAPSGGATVALSSSNNSAATVPASVTVNSGQTTATFTVTAGTVSSDTAVTLTASRGAVTKTTSLTVSPVAVTITSLSLYDTRIMGGESTFGTVNLSGPAPSGGVTISLSSSDPAVQPQASLFLAGGNSAGTFNVNSIAVAAETTVTVTAQLGTSTRTAPLTLAASPAVVSFTIVPSSVVGGKNNPNPIGTVTLGAPAPMDIDIDFGNSHPDVADPDWGGVTIYQGQTTGSTEIYTYPVIIDTVVTFSADSGIGGAKTATLTVTPPVLGEVTIPGGRIPGGRTVKATVTLDPGPPSGGAVISLSSNNPVASVPATVTVPSNVSGATFNIVTSAVSKHTLVTISATYNGVTKTATLKVLGPPSYSVVDVGNLGGGWTRIQGINNLGSAVGASTIDAYLNGRGYIWANGTLTRLDGLLGAEAINNLNEVAGRTEVRIVDTYRGRAVIYRGGSYVAIDPAAGFTDSRASDVNDAGQVVGYSYNAYTAAPGQGFLWQNGTRTELPFIPLGINRWGQAAGNTSGAVLWDKGTLQDLGVPAGRTHSAVEDLNDLGTVVGIVDQYDANGQIEFFRAARWEQGTWTEFGTLGGRNSGARAVNNSGQIVGQAEIDPNRISLTHATLWQPDGELIDLRDELPFDEGWWPQVAYDINNAGQIVAVAVKGSYEYPGVTHGVILTPVGGAAADLALTMAHSPEPAMVGGDLTYTLTVNNSGPLAAANVFLTDTLPAGMTFKSASASTGTASQSGGTVIWQIPSMAKDAGGTLTIVATATAAGSITNSATVTADQIDPVPTNNKATTTTTVVAGGDTTAPVTSATLSPQANASGWNNADVTVTLAASDGGGSGVDLTEYSLGAGATWTAYTAPISVAKEGESAVQYRSRDKAGNLESAKSITIKLDKTLPTGAITINGGVASTDTPGVTLSLTGSDVGGSGVLKMRLADTSAGLATASWEDFATTRPYILAGADGTKTVFVQFQDAAGNASSGYSDEILLVTAPVDTTKPTVSAAVSAGTLGANGWYISDVTVHFTCSDTGSGIPAGACPADQLLSTEGASVSSTARTVTDGAGNVSDPSNVVTVKIDKAAPTGSVTINGGAAQTNKTDVSLTLAGNDLTGSGVAKMRFADSAEGLKTASWVDFAATKSYILTGADGTKTVFAQFQDAAGNASSGYSDEIVLNTAAADTTAPTVTVTSPVDLAVMPAGTAIDFSALDAESGLAPGSPYGSLFDGTTKQPVASGYRPAAGVYTLTVTATDVAGNTTESQPISFTVYDPTGGFVTGAGFIESPAGAYAGDPALVGKAFFGFVSRYEKGATFPTGRTAFEFKVADFSFHGTSFQWLVVNKANSNAQFKGQGLVNGQKDKNGQDYKFQIWAATGSPDTFRIKVWWEDTAGEHPVYDNRTEQAIVGGNILVQAK